MAGNSDGRSFSKPTLDNTQNFCLSDNKRGGSLCVCVRTAMRFKNSKRFHFLLTKVKNKI